MLADVAERFYVDGDFNCAESVLLAANKAYGLGLDPDNCHRLVSAFGGGMGCGALCGALAGGVAVLGYMNVETRAHATEGFRDLCAGYVERFNTALGSCDCEKIKPRLFAPEKRCLQTVRLACDVLEKQLDELRAKNA